MAQLSPRKLPRGKASSYSLVYLSDDKLSAPLLTGLSIATCNPTVETDVKPATVQHAHEGSAADGDKLFTVSTRMSCNFCSTVFANRTEQKAHFKSDWHRYNLKQQIKGDDAITEEQFEDMTGDVSSISGSDDTSTSSSNEDDTLVKLTLPASRHKKSHVYESSDSTDSESEENASIMAATRRHPKVFLRNGEGQLLSMYRSVLYHKKNAPNTPAELLSMAEQAKKYSHVAMVMLAGGHFSAAVFDGTTAVVHKTFHRYVVRAKRGTVQSVRDGQGSAPKSGGATLRRYNEAALALEIQELLASWSEQLKACHLIFLRTSTYSRHIFFSGKTPIFSKDDQRVRTVPFTTGRPTFNEAKRAHQLLMAVECFGDESLATDFVPVSPPRRLHPDTGHLVVSRNTARNKQKVKDKKADRDKAGEKEKTEKTTEEIASDNVGVTYEANDDSTDDNQSEGGVQLVETLTEISTDHLQEYACSVNAPKRNKKKKKKAGQKDEEGETTAEQSTDRNFSQLSEEDARLKDSLYTWCRSGDAAQLSHLLEQLAPAGTQTLPSGPETGACQTQENPSQNHALNPSNSERMDSSESMSETVPCTGGGSSVTPKESDASAQESKAKDRTSDTSVTESLPYSQGSEGGDMARTSVTKDTEQKLESCDAENSTEPCGGDTAGRKEKFEHLVLGQYGSKGLSLLHVAAFAGHGDIITMLLDAGCDPAVRDGGGKTPYITASNKDVRNAFRRFRGEHPDQYDYEAAQIPSGLTADMEAERKQREAEKKKAQKKAKQERLKDRKAEQAKEAVEQKEKERFLALSDRDKRALAAERRILTQAAPAVATPVLNRCYQCGVDISGKVPFMYMEFQFCNPKCLKEHRLQHSKSK
ncbi:tRNA endonuclease ANKZF1-like isoform X1 [Littorina saxatilis]